MTYSNNPQILPKQKQIILGTILGGSSIIKPKKGQNCYLSMRDKDKDWLSYKVSQLSNFFKLDNTTIKRNDTTNRAYSISYPIFNDFYNTFYKGSKKIIKAETLEILDGNAWMVWFVDSGIKTNSRIHLRTNAFGEKGSETINNYFNSLGCECEVNFYKNRYKIVFSNKGSVEFLKIIVHRMPNFIVNKYS